jgi:hypothetical protein
MPKKLLICFTFCGDCHLTIGAILSGSVAVVYDSGDKEKEVEASSTEEQKVQVRRSRRERQLNAKFSGPDWTT